MPRKTPVRKSYTTKDGHTYFGKAAKWFKKLDGRIAAYEAMCSRTKGSSDCYKKPGSINK